MGSAHALISLLVCLVVYLTVYIYSQCTLGCRCGLQVVNGLRIGSVHGLVLGAVRLSNANSRFC